MSSLPDPAIAKQAEPEGLLPHVARGADLVVPLCNGEPPVLLDILEAHHADLAGVRVHQMHALAERAYIRGHLGKHLRHVSYFLSDATRRAFWEGGCDLVPNHFSEVPALLLATIGQGLVLARTSLPDRHGYFSLGTNADYTASLIGRLPFFVEATPHMPRTFGENQIHVSQLVGWCRSDTRLADHAPSVPSSADRKIASLVAERIPDGSTVQVGIGSLGGAITAALSGHRDLGLHTELLSDGAMDLIERGVVTGTRKRLRPNKAVATFCLGSERLYRWLDGNPAVELLPVDWVNDPRVIAQEPNFVSINSATEIDLMGQCASETIGRRYWSSSGGQADFARGALYAENGKAFVALRSTTHDGKSRISATLSPGSVVTTLKNTVDHVVTEWGVAELRGRSLARRAQELISVAHPEHRRQLTAAGRAIGLLH